MNRIIVFVVAVVAGCFVAKAQVPDGSWQWTWMHGSDTFCANNIDGSKGVPHANNTPGCRDHALTWTDTAGNFWLFGGLLVNSTTIEAFLCDLWMFDVNTYEWTFVHGA